MLVYALVLAICCSMGSTEARASRSTEPQTSMLSFMEAEYSGSWPRTLDVPATSSFKLKCSFYGSPQPTIFWQKDGIPMKQTIHEMASPLVDELLSSTVSVTMSMLHVRCANFQAAGQYQCVANNRLKNGTSPVPTYVKIHENGYDRNFSYDCSKQPSYEEILTGEDHCTLPEISLWTDTMYVAPPTPMHLLCRAWGTPKPTIHWMHGDDDERIQNGNDFTILKNGDLIVKEPNFEISSTFTCVASNRCGTVKREVTVIPMVPDENGGGVEQVKAQLNKLPRF